MSTVLHQAAAWPAPHLNETSLDTRAGITAFRRTANSPRRLLEQGYHVDLWGGRGFTPLHMALVAWSDTRDNINAVQALLDAGSSPAMATMDGESALHIAVNYGPFLDPSAVRLLLSHGANLEARDSKGRTPLFGARSASIAQVLIEAGANVHAETAGGMTPLLTAVEHERHKVAALLRKAMSTSSHIRGFRSVKNGGGTIYKKLGPSV